ncbi:hypothetical protein JCM24511_08176 [Saitozyma sp. JCM 24511]|nr:hypothetical protein JCM24511_08176 [Saitozyma sp. JCM 24511]
MLSIIHVTATLLLITEHITESSQQRSLRPVPIDLNDLPDTPPSSVKTLPRIKPEPYSPRSAPRKLPLVKRHSRDDINESSPYRSQAKISLAHAKAHHKYKRGLRFGLNDECWDIAVEVVVHCFSPRYSWFEWNHSGFRDDYLINRRIKNKIALEYMLNIELIERAFDLPHPKFTAMPRVGTIHAINACLKEEWQEASPKSRCTECLDEVRKGKYLADNGKHFDVPCGYLHQEGRCTRCWAMGRTCSNFKGKELANVAADIKGDLQVYVAMTGRLLDRLADVKRDKHGFRKMDEELYQEVVATLQDVNKHYSERTSYPTSFAYKQSKRADRKAKGRPMGFDDDE